MADFERAEQLLGERLVLARDQARTYENWWFIAWAHNHLGDAARCQGDERRAASLYEESLTLFRHHGERQGIAAVLHNLGHVELSQGNRIRARALFVESLSLFQELGFAWSMADCLNGLAGVASQEGFSQRAAMLFGAAAVAHDAIDVSGILTEPANKLAWDREVAAARGKLDPRDWEAAWSSGRTMTLEAAVALALDERP